MRTANVTDALGDFACDRRAADLLYDSGIEFTRLTAEQQTALAATLAALRTAQAGLGDAAVPADTPRPGAQGSSA